MLNNPFPAQHQPGFCLQSFFPASYFPTFQDLTDFKLEQKFNMWNCTLKSKVCTHPIPISVQIDELLLGNELILRQTGFRVKHEGKGLVRHQCRHPNEQEVQEYVPV